MIIYRVAVADMNAKSAYAELSIADNRPITPDELWKLKRLAEAKLLEGDSRSFNSEGR